MLQLSGVEKTSGEPFNVLYAGTSSQLPYIKTQFFADSPSEKVLGKHLVRSLNSIGRKNTCQLVVAVQSNDARWLLPRKGYVLPLWITAKADTTKSPLDCHNLAVKKDLKRISKYGLICEESTCRNDLQFFWKHMYVPYIRCQYGDTAILEREKSFVRQADDGHLRAFFVARDKRRLAGAVVNICEDPPHFKYLGVLHGDRAIRKFGAAAAAYVFMIDWANRNGYPSLNLGSSRPFLTDSVLRFKKRHNITLMKSSHKRVLYINPLSPDTAVNACLVANPMARVERNQLVATVFRHEDHDVTLSESLWKYRGKLIGGLDRVECIDLKALWR
jgi:hypothetical protein